MCTIGIAQNSEFCALAKNTSIDVVLVFQPSLSSGLRVRSSNDAKDWLKSWNSDYVLVDFQADKDTGLAAVLRKRSDFQIVKSTGITGSEAFCFGSCLIATNKSNMQNMNVKSTEDLIIYAMAFPDSPHIDKVKTALKQLNDAAIAKRDPWQARVDNARKNKKELDEILYKYFAVRFKTAVGIWQSRIKVGSKVYVYLFESYIPNVLSPMDPDALDIPSFSQLGSTVDRMAEVDNDYSNVSKDEVARVEQIYELYKKHGDTVLRELAGCSLKRSLLNIAEAPVLVSGIVMNLSETDVKVELVSADFEKAKMYARGDNYPVWLRQLSATLLRAQSGSALWLPATFTFPALK